MRKLDAYTHFCPPGLLDFLEAAAGARHVFRQLFANTPTLIDVDRRLALMDRHGIEAHVLIPLPWLEGAAGVHDRPSVALQAARLCNDGLRRVVAAHPGRLLGVALLPAAASAEQMAGELERAVEELGFAGGAIFLGPTVKRVDHPDYEALYQRAVALDVPLWLHPCRPPTYPDYQDEPRSRYLLWQTLGWVTDTSMAMARLVFGGVFRRYPGLKLITHHHGALIPLFARRMQACYEAFERNSDLDLQIDLEQPYVDHFKQFYCDTATLGYEPLALQMACQFFGVERVLFGSDTPMDAQAGEIFTSETDRTIAALPVTEAERQAIYGGNLQRLLRRRG